LLDVHGGFGGSGLASFAIFPLRGGFGGEPARVALILTLTFALTLDAQAAAG
jgi:hypothetical protein